MGNPGHPQFIAKVGVSWPKFRDGMARLALEKKGQWTERALKQRDAHLGGDKTMVGRKLLNWPHPEAPRPASLTFTVAG